MKKIIYIVFCIAVLSSCAKDDMEVQKNNNLTWKVNKELVQDDIRSAIGYDPRYNYIGVEKSEEEFPVWTLGELVFSEKTTKQLIVSLDKPAEKEINLSLNYNPDLYNDLKNEYGGYVLGEGNLVRILQSEKVIPEGQTSAVFDIEGNFTKAEKMILPFSLKVQGDDSIKKIKGSDIFVIKVDISNFLEGTFTINLSEGSDKVIESYQKGRESIRNNWRTTLSPEVSIGDLGSDGTGIRFYLYYSTVYNFDIDKTNFGISNPRDGRWWGYFKTSLSPIKDLIINSAPYRFEKIDVTKVKLISINDPDVWFIIERK